MILYITRKPNSFFRISGVWHVGWGNLITSVGLIQVGNNRNDHFRYSSGARVGLKGNKFGESATVRLIEDIRLMRCPLNTGFTVSDVNFEKRCYLSYLFFSLPLYQFFQRD